MQIVHFTTCRIVFIYIVVHCFRQQVTCEDILDELRDVFKLFIDRSLFLDCLLIDPDPCYAVLRGEDLSFVEDNTEEQAASKVKRKDGRR
jgi:hypothetical protein